MKEKTTLLLLALIAFIALTTGCATQRDWYKEQGWTPDGFNYTLQRERATGDYSDYFGWSWSFK